MAPVPSGNPFPPIPGMPQNVDFDTWQRFQTFHRERVASGAPAPSYEEFIAWKQFSDAFASHNTPPNASNASVNAPAPPLNMPPVPFTMGGIPIDPMLMLQSISQHMGAFNREGQEKNKRKRTTQEIDTSTDNEADDESSSSEEDDDSDDDTARKSSGRARRRCRSSKVKPKLAKVNKDPGARFLTRQEKNLSTREINVRKQLKNITTNTLYEVTGLGRNPIVVPKMGQQAPPTPRPKAGDKALPVAWGQRVDHPQNVAIIHQVANLVMEQEENPKRATISRKNRTVKFGRGDIEFFVKNVLQNWNARYRAKKEARLCEKLNKTRTNGKRKARQRAIVHRRADIQVLEMFADQNPRMEWIIDLLVTDFMTLEVSTPGEDSENTRQEWFRTVRQAGGLTEAQIAAGVTVLERVSIGWRAKKLTNIFKKLDAIADEILRSSGVKLTRVDFGRKTDGPPSHSVFPCMISKAWLAKNEDTPMPAEDEDPEGVDEIWDEDDLSD